ncbi:MAG: T9SS type A sorting domain-containing protein [Chitinophagaceae bacterium]|nr:T9SS type A sorting domain-containing protein [Chitinophagaceae bacterium]
MKTNLLRLSFFTIAFSFLTLGNTVFAQSIDCTNPSITYDMTAANAARSGATNPTLTNWGTFTNPFSWETNSTASILVTNANVTAVHAGVSGTNVFYGSNNNIPADLISKQTFNLYRGPITLTGRFLNFSTSNQYNEAFLSIIPDDYSTAVPVGQAGAAAVNSRVGISVGGTINGANLTIYDNRDASSSSVSIASAARPAAMTTNTWYTLSATFDIQDGNVVITNVSVNGTTVGFAYPVVIGSSYYPTQVSTQTFTWVNSVRAVASVDDLLDDFTITTNPCYSINGTVFNDANGLTDGIVNGTGINNPAGSTIYAVLVDENENIVNSVTVAAGGTYSFSNVPGGIFEVRLTNKTPGAVNTDAPPASLPAGWINTGENIGVTAGNDGGANGSIIVGTTGSTNVNFGIQAYTAAAYAIDCINNVMTFDMTSSNAQISNSANQSSTGINNPTVWASVTNRFAWEAFGTDANLYGTAAAIPQHADLSGINNPTNVFFGGVWQNANKDNTGQVSADFISKNTFALSAASGPITLVGRFLNKSLYTEENESYLLLLPNSYTHFQPLGRYDPPGFGASVQREGIFIGGNISTSLAIFDNHSATVATTVPASLASWGGLAPAANTWYTLSATFDVQGTNLVVTNVSVNGVTANFNVAPTFKPYPIVVGTVATHSWISSMRVAASADDLMDDFTIIRNPCIYGNVFHDKNGMNDYYVNGTGIGIASGTQLYVVLVNGSGNVVKSVAVAADGTYSISNVTPGNYTTRLCTSAGTVGNPAPAASLPALWANTGENIGAGAGSDGVTNGIMLAVNPTAGTRLTGASPVLTNSTGVFINFGINFGPLPVTLVSFTAAKQEKIVLLKWATATEIDNDYFIIERSSDGTNWETISQVPTQGNGSNLQYYQGKDMTPLSGVNFYRLKQVDIDGKFVYSKTVMVDMRHNNEQTLMLMPNPVIGDGLTLILSDIEATNNCKILLYDMTGKITKTYNWPLVKGTNNITINGMQTLAKGVYQIIVEDQYGRKIGKARFIK